MINNAISLQSVANLPKEIFKQNSELTEKLIKMAVEERVTAQTSPQRLLDIYC